jgi:4-hydroxybenzoate polyprenyltransferase
MRAYLQLVRLPNVLTAAADIVLGYMFTHEQLVEWPHFALLVAISCLLYLAGMALNDYFDRRQDARERPARPIPSGRVSVATARRLGFGMLGIGLGMGWGVTQITADVRPGLVATLLAAAIVLYDGVLKQTAMAPLAMGACRFLNVLLGMSLSEQSWQAAHYVVAGGIGVYITGVTLFARTESRASSRMQLIQGIAVMLTGIALLASLPSWARGDEWPAIQPPPRWYVFWGLIGLLIGWRCLQAVLDPRPLRVQTAVKSCLFSLVILDAAACSATQDYFWPLVIVLLLAPSLLLGRWIYST